jgi:urea transport system substrate-binding protein
MGAVQGAHKLSFAEFRIDTLNERVWRNSEVVRLRPKAFELLVYFANHCQRLVTRKELLENLWHNAPACSSLLRAYVWELRRALGDPADCPRYLETVNRRGYRFLAHVAVQGLHHATPVDGVPPRWRQRDLLVSTSTSDVSIEDDEPPILVGVLHSLTGTMAHSESPVVDATLLAIDQINQRGGLLGRRVKPIVVDGKSNGDEFARLAERLIVEKGARTIFGCWMSAHRKRVLPIVERHDALLMYPVQYEGLECSPSVFYTGAAPNQQIIPAIRWSFGFLNCKRLYLVGSDYIFPRVASEIIRDQVSLLGGQIVGESYIPSGAVEIGDLDAKIAGSRPDMIVNTINGDSNIVFLRSLRSAGMTPDRIPILSLSIGENELRSLDMAGSYAAWNYFQSIDRFENACFVAAFRARYGPQRVTSDPMEAAYVAVNVWAQAVAEGGSEQPARVREFARHQSFNAPEGLVHVDSSNQHTWKVIRIGKVLDDGQLEVIYSSERPIKPEPFPDTRSPQAWNSFLKNFSEHRSQLAWQI